MTRARKCLTALALFGAAALGCNGLLGIDDGAYAPDTDSGISTNPSESGTGEGGTLTDAPTSNDAPTDSNLPKNDAGNELLAEDQNGVISLVQDNDNLYWISNGTVMTVPKSGSKAPSSIVDVTNAALIAVDPGAASSGNVYVVSGRAISSHPKVSGTGTPTSVAMLGLNRTAAALGSDGTSLLLIDYDENTDQAVPKRVATTGGTPTALGSAVNVALLGVTATWAAYIDEPSADSNRKAFDVVSPTSGSPTAHPISNGFSIIPEIRSLFLDSNTMYWLDSSTTSSTILRARDKASNVTDDIASFSGAEEPFVVVANSGKAYVLLTATSGSNVVGEVVKVQKGVAGRTSVIKNLENPTGLVTAGGFVYVGEDRPFSKGTIQRIAAP